MPPKRRSEMEFRKAARQAHFEGWPLAAEQLYHSAWNAVSRATNGSPVTARRSNIASSLAGVYRDLDELALASQWLAIGEQVHALTSREAERTADRPLASFGRVRLSEAQGDLQGARWGYRNIMARALRAATGHVQARLLACDVKLGVPVDWHSANTQHPAAARWAAVAAIREHEFDAAEGLLERAQKGRGGESSGREQILTELVLPLRYFVGGELELGKEALAAATERAHERGMRHAARLATDAFQEYAASGLDYPNP